MDSINEIPSHKCSCGCGKIKMTKKQFSSVQMFKDNHDSDWMPDPQTKYGGIYIEINSMNAHQIAAAYLGLNYCCIEREFVSCTLEEAIKYIEEGYWDVRYFDRDKQKWYKLTINEKFSLAKLISTNFEVQKH